MKILVTEEQYFKLLIEQQVDIEFPEDIEVRYTNFNPDTKNQRTFVYINGVTKDDANKLKELKDSNFDIKVKLINILTNETFEFPLEKVKLTKSSNVPYITIDEYDKIKGELETHEIKLDENFLKKKVSGFPKFITDTLTNLYPNNLGNNSFIDGVGICNSEVGLINIEGTNVPNQTWSILNYFDTNPMVIKKLIEWYMHGVFDNSHIPDEVTISKFEEWVTTNKEKLFKGGDRLKELVGLNIKSYTSGTKTENLTIQKLIDAPFNIDPSKIKQFCSGSNQDRYDGKDVEITTPTGIKYGQIKPLTWSKFNEETNEYVVNTYQMKNYKSKQLDYIIFTNTNDILIFDNKNYKVEDNHFAIFKNPPLTKIV